MGKGSLRSGIERGEGEKSGVSVGVRWVMSVRKGGRRRPSVAFSRGAEAAAGWAKHASLGAALAWLPPRPGAVNSEHMELPQSFRRAPGSAITQCTSGSVLGRCCSWLEALLRPPLSAYEVEGPRAGATHHHYGFSSRSPDRYVAK